MYLRVLLRFAIAFPLLSCPSMYSLVTPRRNLHCCKRLLGISVRIESNICCLCSVEYPLDSRYLRACFILVPSFSKSKSFNFFLCVSVIYKVLICFLFFKFSYPNQYISITFAFLAKYSN